MAERVFAAVERLSTGGRAWLATAPLALVLRTQTERLLAKGMWKTDLESMGLDLEGHPTACGEP